MPVLLSSLLLACGAVPTRPAPDGDAVRHADDPTGVADTTAPVDERAADRASTVPEPSSTSPLPVPEATARPRRGDTVRLLAPVLLETSGLAVSRRDPDVLWAINDGGHAPALHAAASDGRALGQWPIEAINRDWEDLAAFRLDGEPVLLIADTGDNFRRREEVVLHLVAEPVATGPAALPGTPLVPLRSLRFRYEDGAHDVESVAVDETSGTVWLLPKEPVRGGRGVAGGAYALSLADDPPLVARRRATLAGVPRGLAERLAAAVVGIDLEQPTAFDIAEDGLSGCLLTYRRLRCHERAEGESWDEALARPGRILAAHDLDQAEAMALAPDGATLWFTSEGVMPRLRERRLR